MATTALKDNHLKALEDELTALANAQFESPEYRRVFDTPFTVQNARVYFLQHSLFNLNRRDCWGYVQAISPMEVKKIVWEHEEEELSGNKERGVADHYTLAVKQGAAFGLTPEDFRKEQPLDGTFTCLSAWHHLALRSHWLEAFAASAALEYSNSDDVVRGGSLSRRIGRKLEQELGIPMRKQHSNAEHVVADVEHALLLMKVARLYGDSAEARRMILDGAKKSWMIDRTFRGFLGQLMQRHA